MSSDDTTFKRESPWGSPPGGGNDNGNGNGSGQRRSVNVSIENANFKS